MAMMRHMSHLGDVVELPPLVEPGPALSRDDTERYSRHLLLPAIADVGQRRLRAARVVVVGAGGLGSPVLLYLAAAGVGALTIIDDDVVDVTNLQRQVIHPHDSVGCSKAENAARAVTALNPTVEVVTHRERLTRANATALLGGHHLVIDGTDNFATRYTVSDACVELGVPCVWASVYRTQGQVSVFWSGVEGGLDLRDLFPDPPAPGTVPSCGDAGVLGALTGQVGSMMAGEAIKLICGIGRPLLGRVAFVDLLDGTSTIIPLSPRPRDVEQPPQSATPGTAHATVTARALAAELASPTPPTVVDVREPSEVALTAIAGSVRIPLGDVLAAPPDLGADTDIVVHCKVQPRAELAVTALLKVGHKKVRVLEGGIDAWREQVDPSQVRY